MFLDMAMLVESQVSENRQIIVIGLDFTLDFFHKIIKWLQKFELALLLLSAARNASFSYNFV